MKWALTIVALLFVLAVLGFVMFTQWVEDHWL